MVVNRSKLWEQEEAVVAAEVVEEVSEVVPEQEQQWNATFPGKSRMA